MLGESLRLSGLPNALNHIYQYHSDISKILNDYSVSQKLINNTLTSFTSSVQNIDLSNLSIAVQGMTDIYLNEIYKTKKWNELEVVDKVSKTVVAVSDKIIAKPEQLTINDLEEFKISIIGELSKIFEKSKSNRVKIFILNLMTVFSFMLSSYQVYKIESDKSNKNVIIESKQEFENLKKEVNESIRIALTKIYKSRIATTDVNLRFSNRKLSKTLGIVKLGQRVTVIDIRHKWILISYIDDLTGEPKSGYVYKKYFVTEQKD